MQIAPVVVFFSFPSLTLWARIPLLLYTGCILIPATGILFGMASQACQGQLLRLEMLSEMLRVYGLRSLMVLAPLYSLFAWLAALAFLAANFHILALDVLTRLVILFMMVFALYWGPLFAASPQRSASAVLGESIRLVWRNPLGSLAGAFIVLLTWVLGFISVGGVALVVPILAALLQTQYYVHLAPKRLPADTEG
jgi:hypothetical protein